MKRLLLLLICFLPLQMLAENPIDDDCTFNGIPLYGKVKIVDIGETFKVRIVDIGEDIKICESNFNETTCGNWQFVTIGEDFSIRFVTIGEDFTIRFVNLGNGVK